LFMLATKLQVIMFAYFLLNKCIIKEKIIGGFYGKSN